jgi:hypothetical protein
VQVATVALIGEIIDLEEQSTRTKITLEDGTGSITVTIWNDSANADDGDASAPKAALGLTKGMWIRTHAALKDFNGTAQLTSYGVVKEVSVTKFFFFFFLTTIKYLYHQTYIYLTSRGLSFDRSSTKISTR